MARTHQGAGARVWCVQAMPPIPGATYLPSTSSVRGGGMAPTGSFDLVAFKEAQRTDWQLAAAGWRKWYDVLEAGGEIVSRTLVELARIGPGDTVLDVATGYGEPALTAARVVGPTGKVLATDIAADMLEFGRERAARANLDNVEFVEADAEALSFDHESFDAILCRQGLQFLPDASGTLQRFHSFLERDGRFAAAVWGPRDGDRDGDLRDGVARRLHPMGPGRRATDREPAERAVARRSRRGLAQ